LEILEGRDNSEDLGIRWDENIRMDLREMEGSFWLNAYGFG
jgi:hypothetical protein